MTGRTNTLGNLHCGMRGHDTSVAITQEQYLSEQVQIISQSVPAR